MLRLQREGHARVFLLLTTILLTVRCGGNSLSQPSPVPTGGSAPTRVSGTVLGLVTEQTSAGSTAVPGVSIRDTSRARLAVTGADGRYVLGLPDGLARIRIEHPDFEPIDRDVTVSGDVRLDLQLVRRTPIALSGRITEVTPDGPRPVAGVDVEVVVCPSGIPGGAYRLAGGETDADGFYRVPGVCDGETAVFVWKPGYYPPERDRPCEGDGGDCVWVTIAGNTRRDFVLTPSR